jgi:hypothetical protein
MRSGAPPTATSPGCTDSDQAADRPGAARELPERLPGLVKRIYPDGALWVAWPRRAGGHHSDITDNTIREQALPLGVVDVKVAAIDDDWSGIRLVWRLANRA